LRSLFKISSVPVTPLFKTGFCIILCADKDDALVKYSTAGMGDNLFVSKYLVNLPEKSMLEAFIRREIGK